jgi:hypothetical protein
VRERIGSASVSSAGVEGFAMRAPNLQPHMTKQESIMNQYNVTRTAWLSAAAAVLLAASAGVASADNAAPSTTAQPSQQQTGVTQPIVPQPSATSAPASTSYGASKPFSVRTRHGAERGTKSSPRK